MSCDEIIAVTGCHDGEAMAMRWFSDDADGADLSAMYGDDD